MGEGYCGLWFRSKVGGGFRRIEVEGGVLDGE